MNNLLNFLGAVTLGFYLCILMDNKINNNYVEKGYIIIDKQKYKLIKE